MHDTGKGIFCLIEKLAEYEQRKRETYSHGNWMEKFSFKFFGGISVAFSWKVLAGDFVISF